MADQIFNVWDAGENVIGVASNRFGTGHFILSAIHGEASHTLEMLLDATDTRAQMFANGNMIGFIDADGLYQLFEIVDSEVSASDASTLSVYAEHVHYELATEPVFANALSNVPLHYALTQTLQDTRWAVSGVIDAGNQSAASETTNVLARLKTIATAYGIELDYHVTVVRNAIITRSVRAVTRLGTNRGRRFEYAKDTQTIKGKLSISDVRTALIGLGKGSQADAEQNVRLTFADVAWSKAAGKPADKPLGAKYVEDPQAKALYGLAGGTRNRYDFVTFNDVTDPEALLQATWEELQNRITPTASYTLTVIDLEASDGRHEAVRMGDDVYVIHKKVNPPITLTARVSDIQRDLLSPESTQIKLGDTATVLSDTVQRTAKLAELAKNINANGTFASDQLQGRINALTNQLVASGSYAEASVVEGKGILLENNNPQSNGFGALYMGPGIFSIANSKTGDAWNWRTFGTGAGFVADEITTGVLNAAVIKILGTEQFYWDSGNIMVIDPANANRQLRLGKYDGVNYGFAITSDGGSTWQAAMTFDGVVATHLKAADGEFTGNLTAAVTYCNDIRFRSGKSMRVGNFVLDMDGMTAYYSNAAGNLTSEHLWFKQDSSGEAHLGCDSGLYVEANPNYPAIFTGSSMNFYLTANEYGIGMVAYNGYAQASFLPETDRTCNLGCGPISSQGVSSRIWDYAGIRYIYCPDGVHSSSSRTIKHDINPLPDQGDVVDQLMPVTYVLNDDRNEKAQLGLVYEDTVGIAPLICDEFVDGDLSTASITYERLSIILLREVQALRKRVAALEKKTVGDIDNSTEVRL